MPFGGSDLTGRKVWSPFLSPNYFWNFFFFISVSKRKSLLTRPRIQSPIALPRGASLLVNLITVKHKSKEPNFKVYVVNLGSSVSCVRLSKWYISGRSNNWKTILLFTFWGQKEVSMASTSFHCIDHKFCLQLTLQPDH